MTKKDLKTCLCCKIRKFPGGDEPVDFRTRCNHYFHKRCIYQTDKCPKCNGNISRSAVVERRIRNGNYKNFTCMKFFDKMELFISSVRENDMEQFLKIVEYFKKKKSDQFKNNCELIFYACKSENVEMFDILLGIGIEIENLWYYISEACQIGNLEFVERILQLEPNVIEKPYLLYASRNGHVDVVEMLVHMGADRDQKWTGGESPLHGACEYGQFKTTMKLIQLGANVNSRTNLMITPLHLACQNGHVDIVEKLLENGADANCADSYNCYPYTYACRYGHLDCLEKLIEFGANIQQSSNINNRSTILHEICKFGNIDVLNKMLDNRENVYSLDHFCRIPLHVACSNGKIEMVTRLLEIDNYSINCQDSQGQTPLFDACANGNLKIVNVLLSSFANFHISNNQKMTPLHIVCKMGHKNVCKRLLLCGPTVDSRNCYNRTPLHEACIHGFPKIVKTLIKFGADLNCCDHYRKTPMCYARENGHLRIIEILKKNGAISK